MMNLCCDVLKSLAGQTLSTAESCTGGGIGSALTSVSGSSAVYKGGIISYCNEIKHELLGVDLELLQMVGAVSAPVAEAMAIGVRKALNTDVAVSVTGLAGPGGDEYGNSVGTVFIGYSDTRTTMSVEYHFLGDREQVRDQAVMAALNLVLANSNLSLIEAKRSNAHGSLYRNIHV